MEIMEAMERALSDHNVEQNNFWANRPFSTTGLLGHDELLNEDYVAYAVARPFDILQDSLGNDLEELGASVIRIIESKRCAKAAEKPEGQEACFRYSFVHWKQYPSYDYQDGKLVVWFIAACQHGKAPTEEYV